MYGREAHCIELFSHTNIRVEIEDIEDLNQWFSTGVARTPWGARDYSKGCEKV